MPDLTLEMDVAQGAFVEMSVGHSVPFAKDREARGLPKVAPIEIRGIIDTGAKITCIDRSLVDRLDLASISRTRLLSSTSGSSPEARDVYGVMLRVRFPRNKALVVEALEVVANDYTGRGYQALIGLDVLRRCLLIINGPDGRFTLAY